MLRNAEQEKPALLTIGQGSRGNKFLGCAACGQVSAYAEKEQNTIRCLCPRRWTLGVCASQPRNSIALRGTGKPRPLGRRGSASSERLLVFLGYAAMSTCMTLNCYNGAMRKRLKPHQPSAPLATGYWTGSHTTHRLRFHLVFIPKYRRRVLTETIATRLNELIQQACEVHRWSIIELNVQPDHIHLLLQVSPTDSVAAVMQILKGGSARALRLEFPDLTEFLWGTSFWADGYFAETVGQAEEEVVRDYIRNQSHPRPQRLGRSRSAKKISP